MVLFFRPQCCCHVRWTSLAFLNYMHQISGMCHKGAPALVLGFLFFEKWELPGTLVLGQTMTPTAPRLKLPNARTNKKMIHNLHISTNASENILSGLSVIIQMLFACQYCVHYAIYMKQLLLICRGKQGEVEAEEVIDWLFFRILCTLEDTNRTSIAHHC